MNAVDSVNAHLILASRFENIEVAERALHDLCATAGCDACVAAAAGSVALTPGWLQAAASSSAA